MAAAYEQLDLAHLEVPEAFFGLYESMIGDDVRLAEVLPRLARVVQRALAAERATIYIVREATQELEAIALIGNVSTPIRLPIDHTSLAGHCALTRTAFVVDDVHGDLSAVDGRLRFDDRWDRENGYCTRDVMCAPVAFRGDLLGVVQVLNSAGDRFDARSLAALGNVSRLLAYALYHSRVYDDLASLKRLEKEKAEFMMVMVHELKSPIAASQMLAGSAQYLPTDSPRLKDFFSRISGRMDNMLGLVNDILDLAKVRAGRPLGTVDVLDLTAQARQVCDAYVEPADAKGLAFDCAWPGCAVPVRFDSKGLQLVLSNLVSNAVKYTESGGVDVALTVVDATAELTVRDSGIGIPEAEVPRLFHEFFRASNARGKFPGTGVGLAGIKEMVSRFDGRLSLTSVEGEGSTFTLHLPLAG
jgi:signal transduction histidine kinase